MNERERYLNIIKKTTEEIKQTDFDECVLYCSPLHAVVDQLIKEFGLSKDVEHLAHNILREIVKKKLDFLGKNRITLAGGIVWISDYATINKENSYFQPVTQKEIGKTLGVSDVCILRTVRFLKDKLDIDKDKLLTQNPYWKILKMSEKNE